MVNHILKQRPVSRDEVIADAIVHAIAIACAVIGAGVLVWAIVPFGELVPAGIYALALLAMLGFSAAYNLTPASPLKWLLRRFDHSAIYVMIAGTYTPLLTRLENGRLAVMLAIVVWAGALAGCAIKIFMPGRYDRLAVLMYLALGWVGIFAAGAFYAVLPAATMALILTGGLIYTAGVPFYLWDSLKFQNAIWHGFVAAAAACHFAAIAMIYV